jgi:hypothetical protein
MKAYNIEVSASNYEEVILSQETFDCGEVVTSRIFISAHQVGMLIEFLTAARESILTDDLSGVTNENL